MMGDKKKSHTHQGVRGSNSLHSSHSDSRSEVTLVEFVQPNKTYLSGLSLTNWYSENTGACQQNEESLII